MNKRSLSKEGITYMVVKKTLLRKMFLYMLNWILKIFTWSIEFTLPFNPRRIGTRSMPLFMILFCVGLNLSMQ